MSKLETLSIALTLLSVMTVTTVEAAELNGRVAWSNGRPAVGVTLTIGSYSVISNSNGDYAFTFLAKGRQVVSISPSGKKTRSFTVEITDDDMRKDFVITW